MTPIWAAKTRYSTSIVVKHLLGVVNEVELVDRQDDLGDLEEGDQKAVATGLVQETLRASTRITAKSAVDAPVTMLRVYCSCPGVSATMNCRRSVAK